MTSAAALQVNDLVKRVLEMRAAGMTLKAIGEQVGHSHSTVYAWIKTYMVNHPSGAAEAYREAELERLEGHRAKLDAIIAKRHVLYTARGESYETDEPTVKAILADLKISERLARLLGTDREKSPGPESPSDGKAALDAAKAAVAMEEVLRRNGLLKRPAADDVVDVEAAA